MLGLGPERPDFIGRGTHDGFDGDEGFVGHGMMGRCVPLYTRPLFVLRDVADQFLDLAVTHLKDVAKDERDLFTRDFLRENGSFRDDHVVFFRHARDLNDGLTRERGVLDFFIEGGLADVAEEPVHEPLHVVRQAIEDLRMVEFVETVDVPLDGLFVDAHI